YTQLSHECLLIASRSLSKCVQTSGPTPLFLAVHVGFLFFFFILSLSLAASLARSSQPAPPPATLDLTDQVRKYDDSDYNKPIIFFDEHATILVFYPNGDIIYR